MRRDRRKKGGEGEFEALKRLRGKLKTMDRFIGIMEVEVEFVKVSKY